MYNLTFVTRRRRQVLSDRTVARLCLSAQSLACDKYSFKCYAYCLMPDHMHLLAASESGSSLGEFVRHFKQISGFAYIQERGDHLWQISYYDHVLRSDEAVRPVAEYIWDNPVRAGLASGRAEYAFNGPPEYLKES